MSPSRELEFLKFLDNLGKYLRSTREPDKALVFALREFWRVCGSAPAAALSLMT